MYKRQVQELLAHGKNTVNLAKASTSKVRDQATVTSKLIKERVRRDKMDMLEKWHRAESSGTRNEQLEREQHQQELESDTDTAHSEVQISPSIAEPTIELTVNEQLEEIEGDDEMSESIITPSLPLLQDIVGGTNEKYPISADYIEQEEPMDCLLYTSPSPRD